MSVKLTQLTAVICCKYVEEFSEQRYDSRYLRIFSVKKIKCLQHAEKQDLLSFFRA